MPNFIRIDQRLRVHWSLSAVSVTHFPFHASVLRSASQVGPMHKAAGMGKLINAALLSLINEACVNVCCATLPLSQLVSPLVCRHDRVTWEVGRVGLVGRDRGRRGYWVALYLYIYTTRLFFQCFSRCLIQACMPAGRPATQHTSHRRPGPNWAVCVDRAYSSPPTCSPAPSVIAD